MNYIELNYENLFRLPKPTVGRPHFKDPLPINKPTPNRGQLSCKTIAKTLSNRILFKLILTDKRHLTTSYPTLFRIISYWDWLKR